MDLQKKACEILIDKKLYDAKENLNKYKGKKLNFLEFYSLCKKSGLEFQDIIKCDSGKYCTLYYLDIDKNDCKELYEYYDKIEEKEEKAIKLIIKKIDDKEYKFTIEEIEIL